MNKKLAFVLAGLLLTACNKETLNEKTFYNVTFHLKDNVENETVFTYVVKKDQKLQQPDEPIRENYVFSGWFADENLETEFTGFDNYIQQDMDLYAQWGDFESLSDVEKMDRFIRRLEKLTGSVANSYTKETGTLIYYSPVAAQYDFYSEIERNRYKDISIVDYYDENKTYYASQQFLYDNQYFYNLYKDFEVDKNSYKKQARFDASSVEWFLDISLVNVHLGLIKDVSTKLKNGATEEDLVYEFVNLNYTAIDPEDATKTFSFEFYVDYMTVSEELGLVEEIYGVTGGISFANGRIERSKIIEQYTFVLQGEYQMATQVVSETSYKTGSSFAEYSGERFNPANFELQSN